MQLRRSALLGGVTGSIPHSSRVVVSFGVSLLALTAQLATATLPTSPSHHPAVETIPPLPPLAFSVAAFGARGDGVHDDTAAIQAAIQAAEVSGGGAVVFPKRGGAVGGVRPQPCAELGGQLAAINNAFQRFHCHHPHVARPRHHQGGYNFERKHLLTAAKHQQLVLVFYTPSQSTSDPSPTSRLPPAPTAAFPLLDPWFTLG